MAVGLSGWGWSRCLRARRSAGVRGRAIPAPRSKKVRAVRGQKTARTQLTSARRPRENSDQQGQGRTPTMKPYLDLYQSAIATVVDLSQRSAACVQRLKDESMASLCPG